VSSGTVTGWAADFVTNYPAFRGILPGNSAR